LRMIAFFNFSATFF